MLDSHTPVGDTHDFMDDAAAGRALVGGIGTDAVDIVVTPIDPNLGTAGETQLRISEATITFLSVDTGQSVNGVITLQRITSDALSPLRAAHAFAGGAFDPLGGDIEITPPANGIIALTN